MQSMPVRFSVVPAICQDTLWAQASRPEAPTKASREVPNAPIGKTPIYGLIGNCAALLTSHARQQVRKHGVSIDQRRDGHASGAGDSFERCTDEEWDGVQGRCAGLPTQLGPNVAAVMPIGPLQQTAHNLVWVGKREVQHSARPRRRRFFRKSDSMHWRTALARR